MPALAFTDAELAALAASVAEALAPALAITDRPARNLSLREAGDRLRVSETTIRQLVASGDLIANRVGSLLRVSEHEIARFIVASEGRERERLDQMRRQAAITALTRRRRSA